MMNYSDNKKEKQIFSLLEIDSSEQIALKTEIPPFKLLTALRELYQDKSEFNQILFEDHGRIELLDLRKNAYLPFEVAAISHNRRNWFHNYFQIKWIDNLGVISVYTPNRGIIAVRKPSLSRIQNNIYLPKDPHSEKENQLEFNFGRSFSKVKLSVNAKRDLAAQGKKLEELVDTRETAFSGADAEDAAKTAIGPTRLYKQPSAWGYKVIK